MEGRETEASVEVRATDPSADINLMLVRDSQIVTECNRRGYG